MQSYKQIIKCIPSNQGVSHYHFTIYRRKNAPGTKAKIHIYHDKKCTAGGSFYYSRCIVTTIYIITHEVGCLVWVLGIQSGNRCLDWCDRHLIIHNRYHPVHIYGEYQYIYIIVQASEGQCYIRLVLLVAFNSRAGIPIIRLWCVLKQMHNTDIHACTEGSTSGNDAVQMKKKE